MKYCIAILAIVSTGLVNKVNAVTFEGITRFWTASPTNSYISTPNQSEPVQTIEFLKEINSDHPLLLTAEITDGSGNSKYSEQDLSACENYDKSSFKYVAVRLFAKALLPGPKRRKCPVTPQFYEVYRNVGDLITSLDLGDGTYEIAYTVKSDDGELIFSTLKFRFQVASSGSGWGWGR